MLVAKAVAAQVRILRNLKPSSIGLGRVSGRAGSQGQRQSRCCVFTHAVKQAETASVYCGTPVGCCTNKKPSGISSADTDRPSGMSTLRVHLSLDSALHLVLRSWQHILWVGAAQVCSGTAIVLTSQRAHRLQDGRFEEAALLRSRQVELVEALTAAVDAGPRLPRVRSCFTCFQ